MVWASPIIADLVKDYEFESDKGYKDKSYGDKSSSEDKSSTKIIHAKREVLVSTTTIATRTYHKGRGSPTPKARGSPLPNSKGMTSLTQAAQVYVG